MECSDSSRLSHAQSASGFDCVVRSRPLRERAGRSFESGLSARTRSVLLGRSGVRESAGTSGPHPGLAPPPGRRGRDPPRGRFSARTPSPRPGAPRPSSTTARVGMTGRRLRARRAPARRCAPASALPISARRGPCGPSPVPPARSRPSPGPSARRAFPRGRWTPRHRGCPGREAGPERLVHHHPSSRLTVEVDACRIDARQRGQHRPEVQQVVEIRPAPLVPSRSAAAPPVHRRDHDVPGLGEAVGHHQQLGVEGLPGPAPALKTMTGSRPLDATGR